MDRALRRPAGDPALPRPRRRPLRPAPRHHASNTRVGRRGSTRTTAAGRSTTDAGERDRRARFCVMATGCLSVPKRARLPGSTRFAGDVVPHRPLAARGRRLHRQARRRHRHRLVGHPVDPGDRRAGGRARSSSSARRTSASRRATARSTRSTAREVVARYRRAPPARPRVRSPGFDDALNDEAAARRSTTRSASASSRSAAQAGGLHMVRRVHRHADRRGGERDRRRVRPRQDPRARQRPEVAETLCPHDYPFGHQAARASTPTTTRRSTATTSTLVDLRTTPIERDHADGRAHRASASTRSTRSCSPPASTR